ncbi:MAG TPA: tetratricopeptide repeat protein [Acidobacteriota bacterium]|nr:tetratricopeptide repeat protein [Acidobacteriota bacterium]HNG91866.1 tetratricopeptide repeat protein [Acidobacteriota bacterium]
MDDQGLTTEELIKKAEQREEAGLLQEAMECWRTVFKHNSDPICLCQLGRLAKELRQWTEAEQFFLSAIELAPKIRIPYDQLGLLHLHQNNLETAIEYFEQSLAIKGKPGIYSLLGVAQNRLGMTAAARESYEQALKLDPNYEEACYNLGITFREEQPDKAITLFQRAIELDPDYACAYRELGWVQRRTDQFTSAEYNLRKAIELDDQDGWAYIYLGNLLWGKEDVVSAEKAFQLAVKVWPDESISHWSLGDLYWNQEQTQEAKSLYERAVELEPDDAQANFRLGLLLKELGEFTKAKFYLEQTLVFEPEHKKAKDTLNGIK